MKCDVYSTLFSILLRFFFVFMMDISPTFRVSCLVNVNEYLHLTFNIIHLTELII